MCIWPILSSFPSHWVCITSMKTAEVRKLQIPCRKFKRARVMKMLNMCLKTSSSKITARDPLWFHAIITIAWKNKVLMHNVCSNVFLSNTEDLKLPVVTIWKIPTSDQNFYINAKMFVLQQNLSLAFSFQKWSDHVPVS